MLLLPGLHFLQEASPSYKLPTDTFVQTTLLSASSCSLVRICPIQGLRIVAVRHDVFSQMDGYMQQ